MKTPARRLHEMLVGMCGDDDLKISEPSDGGSGAVNRKPLQGQQAKNHDVTDGKGEFELLKLGGNSPGDAMDDDTHLALNP